MWSVSVTGRIGRNMTEDKEMIVGDFILKLKSPEELDVGEGTYPAQGGKFRGVSVGRSDLGFCAFSHRTNSRTYNSPADIPDDVVTFVRSTG